VIGSIIARRFQGPGIVRAFIFCEMRSDLVRKSRASAFAFIDISRCLLALRPI
jgi:hypothetical protein